MPTMDVGDWHGTIEMQTEKAEPTSSVALASLPDDVLRHIFVAVKQTNGVERLGATCKTLHKAARDDAVWQTLYASHYGEASPLHLLDDIDSSTSNAPEFRKRPKAAADWRSRFITKRRQALVDISQLTQACDFNYASPPLSGRASRAGGMPIACSAPSTSQSRAMRVAQWHYVRHSISMKLDEGFLALEDLLSWLLVGCARNVPVGCLAVLDALHRCCVDVRAAVKADRALQAALSSKCVELRVYSFSQRRDCRGFRARDDLRRLSQDLLTLVNARDEDEIWRVMERGVHAEVRDILLSPAE